MLHTWYDAVIVRTVALIVHDLMKNTCMVPIEKDEI